MPESSLVTPHSFGDGDSYEQFMGRWSRRVGEALLEWLQPPGGAEWLDVGCGTGIFTGLIVNMCAPARVVGIDPSQSLISLARQRADMANAEFRLGDVQALPFEDATFDVLASSLVLNFVPDKERALSEICRVTRPGGLITACVWDFGAESSPSGPLRRAMRRMGIDVPAIPGTEESQLSSLIQLFKRGSLTDIVTTTIDASVSFRCFDDLWVSQTTSNPAVSDLIAAITPKDRNDLTVALRSGLQQYAGGAVRYSARANVIKARRHS